jgi:hypothetical protein
LSITTNDSGKDGYFGFLRNGHVSFANLSSALAINGASNSLAGDIATLAADIAANPAGNFALAASYDAEVDGVYTASPIPTQFSGSFEGLGNTISRLSIEDTQTGDFVGLFGELASGGQAGGAIENINLTHVIIGAGLATVGGLVGVNKGYISNALVSGTLTADAQNGDAAVGGIAGDNTGANMRSYATGIIGDVHSLLLAGGLVGYNYNGTISQSYANCKVMGSDDGALGGLVGSNAGPITQSYAMGSVQGGSGTYIGGLTGANGMISQSYSTAKIGKGHNNQNAGGLIGIDDTRGNGSDYWDVSTSRIKHRDRGAGTPKNDPGITGLTTRQLQSGLPKGFDSTVWAEDKKINGGLPYLIDNPPR